MATQTTYSERHAAAYPGMIASEIPNTLVSVNAEEVILFGAVVVKGTGDRDGKSPNANGENGYIGIAVREVSSRLSTAAATDRFNVGDEARVMTKGDIWVTAGGNVVAGANVYFTEATGALDDASGANITQIPNAKWLDTVSSGALARIRLG